MNFDRASFRRALPDVVPAKAHRPLILAFVLLVVAITVAALLARIQTYPLRHDEQFYIPAGILFTPAGLYRDFGYNQLPNLPIVLHALFQLGGVSRFLLAGRTLLFVAWLVAGGSLAVASWRMSRSLIATAFAIALLVTNPILLGPAGMTVTNNFLPVACLLLGTMLFIEGCHAVRWRSALFFAAGFAISAAMGFKANYVFLGPVFAVAALCVPSRASWGERLRRSVAPFVVGAILGGLPTLLYALSDPDGFLAHVVRYHRGAQIAYWNTADGENGDVATSWGDKWKLARSLWLTDAGGLIPLSIILLAAMKFLPIRREPTEKPGGPVIALLLLCLTIFGVMISFVPTPAFPQYFAPPLAFAILAVPLLYGALHDERRAAGKLVVLGAFLYLLVIGAPRLLLDLPGLAHPAHWTGNVVHKQSREIARAMPAGNPTIATLAPLYALEGGRSVYPELSAGFVLYRVGGILRATEPSHYHYLADPTTIDGLLTRRPPGAILTGTEAALDQPFNDFAQRNGYRALPIDMTGRRGEHISVFVR